MLLAQSGPTFEVASIKKAEPIDINAVMSGKLKVGMTIDAAMVHITSMSISDLLRYAYKVTTFQISGPDWLKAERFDITAKMPAGANRDQIPQMVQALLADRFKVVLHRSTTEKPVYALIVTKPGKLKESPPDPDAPATSSDAPAAPTAPTPTDGGAQVRASATSDSSGNINMNSVNGNAKIVPGENGMRIEITKMNTTGLVELLGRFVERPVVDASGLKGRYDMKIDLSLEDAMKMGRAAGMMMPSRPSDSGAADPGTSSVFNAIDVYGLKLDARKVPIELLIIDSVEKTPTEN